MSAETAEYAVLRVLGEGIEIRQYSKQTLISTDATDQNTAFSILANYIFGGNAEGIRISMTTPVTTVLNDNGLQMSFVLPSGYYADNVPNPRDERITIRELEPRKIATIRFSGHLNRGKYMQKKHELVEILERESIVVKGNAFLMQYDPPWVFPMLRHNEVAIEVD
jgi:hypothetical protein